jgi:hypothetical protein
MAEVVIDEAELNTLVAAKKLLEQLNGHKDTRPMLQRAIKVHHPEVQTEEDVAEQYAAPIRSEVQQSLSKIEERIAALDAREARVKEQDTLLEMQSSFGRLKEQFGYNDDGIEKIKQLMVDRSIPDPEAAAALFERLNPAPVETRSSWSPDRYNFENDAVDHDVKGLFENPDKWEDAMIGKVLLDERKHA